MPSRPDTSSSDPARTSSALDDARAAAGTPALELRVAELERTLASERAQSAHRAREVEMGVVVLRNTLEDLQAESQRIREERDRLQGQLDQSRRLVQTMACQPDPVQDDRVREIQAALDQSRAEVSEALGALNAALLDVEPLRARVRTLETQLANAALELDHRQIAGDASPPSVQRPQVVPPVRAGRTSVQLPPPPPAPAPASAPAPAPACASGPAAQGGDASHDAPAEPEADPDFPQVAGVRIERLAAEDATSRTYDAREIESRRPVVVRVFTGARSLLAGNRLDAAMLSRHPNLVAVLSFSVCRDGPYLVIERADGETATAWVRRLGVLPDRIALSVMLEAARGLRQAAFHGALHGDLSPDDVLVDVAGRVRIRGVGLGGVLAGQDAPPTDPGFAAPERIRGGAAPDVRSDLYSLGAVVFFLLTGKAPYEGDGAAVLRGQEDGPLPDVRATRPDVSEETSKILRRMLAPDPAMRPQTWDQVLVELERRVSGRVAPLLRSTASSRVRHLVLQHPWVLGVAVAAPLVVAGIWRLTMADDPTAADRFREATVIAERLVQSGDTDAAKAVYRRFLTGTGDVDVEREAARRFDALNGGAVVPK